MREWTRDNDNPKIAICIKDYTITQMSQPAMDYRKYEFIKGKPYKYIKYYSIPRYYVYARPYDSCTITTKEEFKEYFRIFT